MRDRTRHELEQALAKKQVPDHAAAEALDRLTEVGLIDDQRFADAWFEAQQRRQRSTRALRHELRTKGVHDGSSIRRCGSGRRRRRPAGGTGAGGQAAAVASAA